MANTIKANAVKKDRTARQSAVTGSSGNVFADLGVKEPDEALAKAELARQISGIIRSRNLSQTRAAEILGIDQPKVSALMRGRLAGFSTDRLLRMLNALGLDVEIRIQPKVKPDPAIRVFAMASSAMAGRKSAGRRVDHHGREITRRDSNVSKPRDTYKYQFKVGNKIIHGGITNDLDRREQEHQQKWPKGHITQVGRRTTEDAARRWTNAKGYGPIAHKSRRK